MLIRVSDTGRVVVGLRKSPSGFEESESGTLLGSELTPGNYPQFNEQFKPKRRWWGLEFRLPEIHGAVSGNCHIGRRRARVHPDHNRSASARSPRPGPGRGE